MQQGWGERGEREREKERESSNEGTDGWMEKEGRESESEALLGQQCILGADAAPALGMEGEGSPARAAGRAQTGTTE